MTVYVDDMQPVLKTPKWPYRTACHMFASSLSELHVMAARLGLKRSWFQSHPRLPHYDLTATKRAMAIGHGAKPASKNEVVKHMRGAGEGKDHLVPVGGPGGRPVEIKT